MPARRMLARAVVTVDALVEALAVGAVAVSIAAIGFSVNREAAAAAQDAAASMTALDLYRYLSADGAMANVVYVDYLNDPTNDSARFVWFEPDGSVVQVDYRPDVITGTLVRVRRVWSPATGSQPTVSQRPVGYGSPVSGLTFANGQAGQLEVLGTPESTSVQADALLPVRIPAHPPAQPPAAPAASLTPGPGGPGGGPTPPGPGTGRGPGGGAHGRR